MLGQSIGDTKGSHPEAGPLIVVQDPQQSRDRLMLSIHWDWMLAHNRHKIQVPGGRMVVPNRETSAIALRTTPLSAHARAPL